MENENKLSSGMRLLAIITSLFMIAAGLYLFFNLRKIVPLFSAVVLVNGIMLIIRYFGMKDKRNGWDILSGIINLLFGSVMLFGGTQTRVMGAVAIEMYIAFWVIFQGFAHVFGSVGPKKEGAKNWFWSLIGGILMIICGFIFISMPLFGTLVLVEIGGIYASVAFFIGGLTGLAAALSGKNSQVPA